jgi:hypothetical protein
MQLRVYTRPSACFVFEIDPAVALEAGKSIAAAARVVLKKREK